MIVVGINKIPALVERTDTITDPELKLLADRLPEVLLNKWSSSTNKQYAAAWNGWENWASRFKEVDVLPADPLYVCLYFLSLQQRVVSVATLNTAVAGMAWKHKLAGLESPTQNITVTTCVDGLRRALSKPVNKTSPILVEHLDKIVLQMDPTSISDLRIVSLILLAFSGFMRFNEVVNIRMQDIDLLSTHLVLNIRSSKTDQLRKGHLLHIAKTATCNCPVEMLMKYLCVSKMDQESTGFIFKSLQQYKGNLRLVHSDKPLTYTRTRELVKQQFIGIGLDSSLYSLHSLRSGGASAAARNNIPDRLFQRHGRWLTDSVKNSYVDESLDNLLMVSKNLGL
jgi:integrase